MENENNLIYLTDNLRHLICEPYSVKNLHQMAKELKINRCWFHSGLYPHYDIPKKRIKEITDKCHLIKSKELLKIIISSVDYPYKK